MRPCPRWFRPLLVVCLLLPLGVLLWSPVHGQFPPNQPGMPNIPRPNFPNIPQPNIPRPNIPNIPRPNIPQIEIPRTETVWSCSICRRELGRGPIPPAVTRCPGCGASLNGVINPPNNPPQPHTPAPANNNFGRVNLPPAAAAAAAPSSEGSNAWLWITLGIVGVVVLAGVVIALLLLTRNPKKSKRKRKKAALVEIVEEIPEFEPEPVFELVPPAASSSAAIKASSTGSGAPAVAPEPVLELPRTPPPKVVRPSAVKIQAPPLVGRGAAPGKTAPRPVAAKPNLPAKPAVMGPTAANGKPSAAAPPPPRTQASAPKRPAPPPPPKRPPQA